MKSAATSTRSTKRKREPDPTEKAASLFWDKIRGSFAKEPERYEEFLVKVRKFEANKIQTDEFVAQINELFGGKNRLFSDLCKFLPLEVTEQDDDVTRRVTRRLSEQHAVANNKSTALMMLRHGLAVNYVTRVRNYFATEPSVYRTFLKILHTYQKDQTGVKEVVSQVSQLFANHPDLLTEFTFFLPERVVEKARVIMQEAVNEAKRRRMQHRHAPASSSSPALPATDTVTAVPGEVPQHPTRSEDAPAELTSGADGSSDK